MIGTVDIPSCIASVSLQIETNSSNNKVNRLLPRKHFVIVPIFTQCSTWSKFIVGAAEKQYVMVKG